MAHTDNRNQSVSSREKEIYEEAAAGSAFFLGAAFLGAAAFLAAGFFSLAVVFVTRPDLVLPNTLGASTTAGACKSQ